MCNSSTQHWNKKGHNYHLKQSLWNMFTDRTFDGNILLACAYNQCQKVWMYPDEPRTERASEKHWERCSFYSTSDFFFLLIADAWVLKRAAVLMCSSLPANCATLSSLVFKSVWSVWEHFTVRDHFMDKQTHYPSHMVGLRSVGTDPYFFRLLSFLMLFFS